MDRDRGYRVFLQDFRAEIGRQLLACGHVIVFATGYGAGILPPELRHVRVLQEPFHQEDLERALRTALAERRRPVAG